MESSITTNLFKRGARWKHLQRRDVPTLDLADIERLIQASRLCDEPTSILSYSTRGQNAVVKFAVWIGGKLEHRIAHIKDARIIASVRCPR